MMKFSAVSTAIALTGFTQSSLQAPTGTATGSAPAATTSAAHYYLRINTSTNKTQVAWYGFVDPKNAGNNGIAFQFTPGQADATVFTLLKDPNTGATLLQGYKDGWVAGSTNVEGTAAGGTVYQAPYGLYTQGGEPLVNAVINPRNAATLLTDRLGNGLVRNHSQTCYPAGVPTKNKTLPVLVVGEKAFAGCNNITLILTPAK